MAADNNGLKNDIGNLIIGGKGRDDLIDRGLGSEKS